MLGSSRFLCLLLFFISQFNSSITYSRDAPLNLARIANKISPIRDFNFQNLEAFNLLELSEDDWSSIKIDGMYIPAPKKASKLLRYLTKVQEVLNSSDKTTAKLQFGDREPITIKLPFLGRGHNGAVYEIETSFAEKKVIKFTLPRLQAVQSAIIEYEGYDFWLYEASKSRNFSIPIQYDAHKLGFYRTMEKNNGITLTKFLLMLGAIHIDDLASKETSFNDKFLSGIYSVQATQIAQAIQSMIGIISNNPKRCVSLSPNNIHVTYDLENLAIERIDLVDIGPVPSKLAVYQQLENFNQFLELCAERLKKYLTGREYSYDVEELSRYQALYSGPQLKWNLQ
ncbi:MAG: hypothetical protein AB8G05_03425 [Oligoflexales bacterium]